MTEREKGSEFASVNNKKWLEQINGKEMLYHVGMLSIVYIDIVSSKERKL